MAVCCVSHWPWPTSDLADDLVAEREKSKLLQEEMEATLHDIQNMWTPRSFPRSRARLTNS